MSNRNSVIEKQNIINLFNQKKFSKISKISSKIRNLFENQPDIIKMIVMSDLNTKNFIKAEQFIRKVLILNNTDAYNYILGNTLKFQNKYEEAIEAYKKSISLNNNFSEAYNNLANVQKKIESFDDALLNYKNAIRTNQNNSEAYLKINASNSSSWIEEGIDSLTGESKESKINFTSSEPATGYEFLSHSLVQMVVL